MARTADAMWGAVIGRARLFFFFFLVLSCYEPYPMRAEPWPRLVRDRMRRWQGEKLSGPRGRHVRIEMLLPKCPSPTFTE